MADPSPDAAILLMLLAEDQAAQIVGELNPREVEMLGKAMVALSEVGSADAEVALDRFVASARAQTAVKVDGTERTRTVLTRALGDAPGEAVMARIAPPVPSAQIAPLKWMRDSEIVAVLRTEHPQVAAAILSDVEPERAAQLMVELEPALQDEIVRRMVRMGPVAPFALDALIAMLGERTRQPTADPADATQRIGTAAAILSKMPKPVPDAILKLIGKRDKGLAQALSDEMFVFGDILKLDAKTLALVMRAVDAEVLALAIKPLSDSERELMLAGLSQRAAQTIRDDIEERGPVALAEVEAAQKAIVAVVRQLESEGALQLGGGDAAYV